MSKLPFYIRRYSLKQRPNGFIHNNPNGRWCRVSEITKLLVRTEANHRVQIEALQHQIAQLRSVISAMQTNIELGIDYDAD